jgi:hypothetical protein
VASSLLVLQQKFGIISEHLYNVQSTAETVKLLVGYFVAVPTISSILVLRTMNNKYKRKVHGCTIGGFSRTQLSE